jgi:hypothetical protein
LGNIPGEMPAYEALARHRWLFAGPRGRRAEQRPTGFWLTLRDASGRHEKYRTGNKSYDRKSNSALELPPKLRPRASSRNRNDAGV